MFYASVIKDTSLLPCQMWSRPVFLVRILLRCPSRLCPWSFTLRHAHHSSQYSHFLLFPKPSPLLYADDTQLFLSFLRTHFDSSIDHLQNALNRISSSLHWTPLRLNFCSLVSVNNLPKSTTPHLTPLTLLETSASYLMNTSPFLTKSCYYHTRQLRSIRPYLDSKIASTVATSIVHSKLE